MTEQLVTEFFRCQSCYKALEMNEWLAKKNSSCVCGSNRFCPTRISKLETIAYLITHPRVTFDTLWEKMKWKKQK